MSKGEPHLIYISCEDVLELRDYSLNRTVRSNTYRSQRCLTPSICTTVSLFPSSTYFPISPIGTSTHFIAMRDLFREAVFGRSIHFISGGAAFSPQIKLHPQRKMLPIKKKGKILSLSTGLRMIPRSYYTHGRSTYGRRLTSDRTLATGPHPRNSSSLFKFAYSLPLFTLAQLSTPLACQT